MRTSEKISKIAPALTKAVVEVGKAHKDAKNPFYHSNYATLESVMDAYTEPFRKNGLCIISSPGIVPVHNENGHISGYKNILTVRVQHESGEYIEGDYLLTPVKENDPQAVGSAISYARRYLSQAIAGVVATDDDGNAASGISVVKKKVVAAKNTPTTKKVASKKKDTPTTADNKKPAVKINIKNEEQEVSRATIRKAERLAKILVGAVREIKGKEVSHDEVLSQAAQRMFGKDFYNLSEKEAGRIIEVLTAKAEEFSPTKK